MTKCEKCGKPATNHVLRFSTKVELCRKHFLEVFRLYGFQDVRVKSL